MTDNAYDDACRFLGGEDRLQAILVDVCEFITYDPATKLLKHLGDGLPLKELSEGDASEQMTPYKFEEVYVSIDDTHKDVPQLTFGCCICGEAGEGAYFPLHRTEDGSWAVDLSQPPSWVIH